MGMSVPSLHRESTDSLILFWFYCFNNNSIQGVHHHSFMTTVFGICFAYMEVCNNGFFTQTGCVGPNAGWHKAFLPFATLLAK